MFRNDLGLKIFSVVIGFVLWFYVTYPAANNPTDYRVFTVQYTNLDSDSYAVLQEHPSPIRVSVRGPAESLRDLHAYADNQFIAEINLQNAQPGDYSYPVTLHIGPNVKSDGLEFLPPKQVPVRIVSKVRSPMLVTFEGVDAPPGQDITNATMIPDRITIRGPKAEVQEVKKAVAVVDLKDYPTQKEFVCHVELRNAKGQLVGGVESVPDAVQVQPTLGPAVDQRKLPVSLTWGSPLRHGYSIRDVRCDPAEVLVKGKTNALKKISVVRTEAINLSDVSSERELQVRLIPPRGGLQMEVKTVSVRISVSRPPVAPPPPPKLDTEPPTPLGSRPITPNITAH